MTSKRANYLASISKSKTKIKKWERAAVRLSTKENETFRIYNTTAYYKGKTKGQYRAQLKRAKTIESQKRAVAAIKRIEAQNQQTLTKMSWETDAQYATRLSNWKLEKTATGYTQNVTNEELNKYLKQVNEGNELIKQLPNRYSTHMKVGRRDDYSFYKNGKRVLWDSQEDKPVYLDEDTGAIDEDSTLIENMEVLENV